MIILNAHGCTNLNKIKLFNYTILQNNLSNQLHDGAPIAVRRDISFKRIELFKEMFLVKIEVTCEEKVMDAL